MIVYLPEGYDESGKRYPVVYMLHGARGYETSWILKGDILHITDSLVTGGLAEPAIIVMPNVNQYDTDADMDLSRRKSALESLFEIDGTVETAFLNDVVAFTDNHFRTIPDKRHRAIGGLSIGGLHSLYISANAWSHNVGKRQARQAILLVTLATKYRFLFLLSLLQQL